MLKVDNDVATAPRQAWHGFGWGLGDAAINVNTQINANKEQLFAELGTKVLRLNHPGKAEQATTGKDAIAIGVANGVDTVLSTGYLWRIQNDGTPSYSATTMAAEIDALMDDGVLITHATIQNEPDGNTQNPPDPGLPATVIPVLNAAYNELRGELNDRGRSSVKLYGCEWAHNSGSGQFSEQEYDTLNAASMIPNVVAFGGGHNYHDCPTNTQYDSRWMTKTSGGLPSSGIISSETGIMGMPNYGARCIAAINHGSIMEVAHIGQSNHNNDFDPNGQNQTLVKANGTRRPWHTQARVIYGRQDPSGDITIPRGSRFRLVTCSDRPPTNAYGTLNTTFADRMIRNNGSLYPRLNSACCKRPDGRWTFVCCNTTHGSEDVAADLRAEDPPLPAGAGLSGHYAGVTIQVTVTIQDLVNENADDVTWSARRCSITGALSSSTVNQHNGQIRFTLDPGETIGMISDPVGAAVQTWSDGANWSDGTGWTD